MKKKNTPIINIGNRDEVVESSLHSLFERIEQHSSENRFHPNSNFSDKLNLSHLGKERLSIALSKTQDEDEFSAEGSFDVNKKNKSNVKARELDVLINHKRRKGNWLRGWLKKCLNFLLNSKIKKSTKKMEDTSINTVIDDIVVDRNFSGISKKLSNQFEEQLSLIMESYNMQIAALKKRIENQKEYCEHNKSLVLERQAFKHDVLRENHLKTKKRIANDFRLSMLKHEWESSASEFEDKTEKLNRSHLDSIIPRKLGLALMSILFLLELPFVYNFLKVFMISEVITLAISIAISMSLVISANMIGFSLRTRKFDLISWILAAICILSLQVVAYFGTNHLNNEALGSSFFDFGGLFFFIIGILIYGICCLVSFYSHDSVLEFEKLYKSQLKLRSRYLKYRTSIECKLALEEERFFREILLIKEEQAELLLKYRTFEELELERLKKARNGILKEYDEIFQRHKKWKSINANYFVENVSLEKERDIEEMNKRVFQKTENSQSTQPKRAK